jgi:hypothetical protein
VTALRSDVTGDAKAVVRILKMGRNAGAGGAARDLDVMAPGTSARGSALSVLWTVRIAFRRSSVVRGRIPVTAPFVHILADIV